MDSTIVEQARNADVIAFFEKHNGFTFAHHGGVYRCNQHKSLAVKNDRLSWYWHSKGIGGFGVLDYLMKVEGLSFREAVDAVTSIPAAAPISAEPPPSGNLILPEKAGFLQSRLYSYLCNKRGIDGEIVSALLDENRIYEDRRGNVVFIGFDDMSKPRFASLRGTYGDCRFRMDCTGSDKRYGFTMAYSEAKSLYIFESPIDAMSHASLANAAANDKTAWRQKNRLSLAGTSDTALSKYLETHPRTNELALCLDNDHAGQQAAVSIARKYADIGYLTRIELASGKDFNEDLAAFRTSQKNKIHREQYI